MPARKRTLEVTTTWLEMHERPVAPFPPMPRMEHPGMLLRVADPTVPFYRFLYSTVGAPWLWYERRLLDDSALAAILGDPAVDLYVLYVGGQPAGYVELDARRRGEVELAYLGLMEPFIGRGLGRYLVGWGVRRAWDRHPDRIWVHTCTFDHPAALGSYQKAGFAPFKRETKRIPDPRPLK